MTFGASVFVSTGGTPQLALIVGSVGETNIFTIQPLAGDGMVSMTIITPAIAGDTMVMENITSNTAGNIVLNSVFNHGFGVSDSPVAYITIVRVQ